MRTITLDRACRRPLAQVFCLTVFALSGCARADAPELFRADPNLLNDYHQNLPTHGSSGGFKYEIIQGLAIFEGDIILGPVNMDGNLQGKLSARGLGRSDAFGRWPDGIVPYLAPTNNSPTQRANVALAIQHWMDNTSITFVERTNENADQYPHYIRFDSTNSCASTVGMQGGAQSVHISDACSMGNIVHELGHVLGLYHEHTRSDRDNFVQIDWDQIRSGREINFELLNGGVENYGTYDYGSIMHYGPMFFSATNRPTIIAPDGIEIGQRVALSAIDAQSVNTMYATDLALMQPVVNAAENGLELNISIANQGNLGAQQLELIVRAANADRWSGISRDSGWGCESFDHELRCSRATLHEQNESRFTLLLDTEANDASAIRMLLSSRTMDTDETNNRINDDGSLTPSANQLASNRGVQSMPETESGDATPSLTIPNVAAANPDNGFSSDQTAGAGSDNGALFALVLAAFGWRRMKGHRRNPAISPDT